MDTGGIEQDKIHIKEIVEFLIENGAFNAICFVIKSSVNRDCTALRYCLDEFQ